MYLLKNQGITKFLNIFLICFGLTTLAHTANGQADIAKGKELFSGNCASCHGVGDKAVVGPGLKGVHDRRNEAWLLKWIKNSSAVIASGDAYAVALYNQYGKAQMQSFPDLKDDDIKNILGYIKAEGEKVVLISDRGPKGPENPNPESGSGYNNVILAGMVVTLLLVLVTLSLVVSLLTKNLQHKELAEADKEVVNQKIDLESIFRSSAFLAVIGVFFFLVVAKAGIDKTMKIGKQTGYAPTQPISFSHKLHAGKYEINCQYCHTSVYKGKSANIPSVNICMNCHNAIKRTSPQIQKIYEAAEKNQPIQWIRVHNLPDLVYFNHSQHTVAGQIECKSCHGDIANMEVVQQRSPLSMGWCIDCHRQTVVKSEGNVYYDKLMAAHKRSGGKEKKVKDIGGLECSKCHY